MPSRLRHQHVHRLRPGRQHRVGQVYRHGPGAPVAQRVRGGAGTGNAAAGTSAEVDPAASDEAGAAVLQVTAVGPLPV